MVFRANRSCLDTLISGGAFSVYQMVFGSNPVDLSGWEDKDEDLVFAQDTPLSGQFAHQWKLRMMAQEAALNEIASSKLRRSLAFNKSCACADVKIGDAILCNKAQRKKSTPRRRGPALILDIDETGVTAKVQSQTLKVARFCVRKKGEEKDAEDAESHPMREQFRRIRADLGSHLRQVDVGKDSGADREDGNARG